MTTQVCLVGDRHLFMAGLAKILNEHPFEVALEVGSVGQAIEAGFGAGLIIVDKSSAVSDLEADLGRLKQASADCRVVVITDRLDQGEMAMSFAAGIDGYLLEAISPEALRESLNLVVLGEHVFPSQLVALLRSDVRWSGRSLPAAAPPDAALSERETEIVARLAEGMPNKVIASDLTITEATVKVHLKSILKKLGVSNRTQAAVWAVSHRMTQAPQVVQ